MKVEVVLDKLYKRKKDGNLSHFANRFMDNNSFVEGQSYSIDELILAVASISNREKRERTILFLTKERMKEVENNNNKKVFQVGDLRKKTYHETVRALHPDNQETGDRDSFDLVQLLGYHLWDYRGKPRKEVKRISDRKKGWEADKELAETGKIDIFKHMKKQTSTEDGEDYPF